MNYGLAYPGESQERFTYSRVPLAMRKDPDLTPTDIVVAMFVLPWLKGSNRGWATVNTIACGAKLCERAVQYSLRRLEKAGWFAVEKCKVNRTRREFTALWLTDDGFEVLANRLGVTSTAVQVPRLIYVQKIARVHGDAPKVLGGTNRSFQLLDSPEACMSNNEQSLATSSPSAKSALDAIEANSSIATEASRNAAAIDRGVRGVYRSRLPRKLLGGTIGCVARLVAKTLGDDHSHRFHCGVLWCVADGELSPDIYLNAYATALNETATREGEKIVARGARFKRMIEAMELRRTDAEYAEEWADQHVA